MMLLASVYMLVYSGRVESGDALRFFDAVSSNVHHGDILLDESFWFVSNPNLSPDATYPLPSFNLEEPFKFALTIPLYQLADALALGQVHVVWFFNVIVTALTGGVIFWYSLVLGYQERTAILATLIFGIGTMVIAYTKTMFHEPLVMLLLALTGVSIEWARQRRNLWAIVGLLFAGVCIFAAFKTKPSSFLAIPALAILALPTINRIREQRWFNGMAYGLLIACLSIIFWAMSSEDVMDFLIDLAKPIIGFGDYQFARTAVYAYLMSPGGSIFGTSPILLLALPGFIGYLMRPNLRFVCAVIVLLAGYAFGHAILTQIHWFGGLSWPPRFLLPTIPFLTLGALPILESMINSKKWRIVWGIPFIILLIYSLWIQFNAVAVDWIQYPTLLPSEANSVADWLPGLTQPEYFRWTLLPSVWDALGLDFAWIRTDTPLWAFGYIGLIILSLGLIAFTLRQKIRLWMAMFLIPAWLIIAFLGLKAIYPIDGAFRGGQTALHETLAILDNEAESDDVLLLTNSTYERFFLNYNTLASPRTIILRHQPAQPTSQSVPALIESNNPNDWLYFDTLMMIRHLAIKRDRIWLLSDTSDFLTWSFRPIERWLSRHYYPLRDVPLQTQDPTVRLLEFYTGHPAPDPFGFQLPTQSTQIQFGESLRLDGFNLPAGTDYQAGQVVPISFYWGLDEPIDQNLIIAWFFAKPDGSIIVQGQDSPPNFGFSPTNTWETHQRIWDNRALELPTDLPAGDYQLWLVVYFNEGEIQRLPVTGTESTEDNIAILPITVTITP